MPTVALRQVNKVLGRNSVTKYGLGQGIVVLSRWSRSASARRSAGAPTRLSPPWR
ncbi:hypothetical protein AB8B12_16750 [Streptomyces sp. PGLac3x]